MTIDNVTSTDAAELLRPDSFTVPDKVARISANEQNRLWQAHGIIELVVHAIGDEVDNGGPAIKPALRGAADIIFTSINELERIYGCEEVQL
jgi:hypothetical protein